MQTWCGGAACEPPGGRVAPSWGPSPSAGWPHSSHPSVALLLQLIAPRLYQHTFNFAPSQAVHLLLEIQLSILRHTAMHS